MPRRRVTRLGRSTKNALTVARSRGKGSAEYKENLRKWRLLNAARKEALKASLEREAARKALEAARKAEIKAAEQARAEKRLNARLNRIYLLRAPQAVYEERRTAARARYELRKAANVKAEAEKEVKAGYEHNVSVKAGYKHKKAAKVRHEAQKVSKAKYEAQKVANAKPEAKEATNARYEDGDVDNPKLKDTEDYNIVNADFEVYNRVKPDFETSNIDKPDLEACNTVNPNFETSNTVNPNFETSNTDKPNFETSNTVNSNTGAYNIVNADFEVYNRVKPDFETSIIDKPDLEACNTVNPNFETSNTVNPNFETSNTDKPNFETSNTEKPNLEAYKTVNPNFETPNTDKPNLEAYNTVNPNFEISNTVNPNFDISNTDKPNLEAYITVNPNFEAYNTVNPNLEAYNRVNAAFEAYNSINPNFEAYNRVNTHFEAYNRHNFEVYSRYNFEAYNRYNFEVFNRLNANFEAYNRVHPHCEAYNRGTPDCDASNRFNPNCEAHNENVVTDFEALNSRGVMAALAPAPGLVQVKQEKPDDPEILEMAAKIAEANRIKLAQTSAQATSAAGRTLNGAANLRGYIVATGTGGVVKPLASIPLPPDTKTDAKSEVDTPLDEPSTRGKFSWTVIGSSSVPVILRRDGKYISVRIMEMKVLATFLNFLHPDIYLQARVPSYAMTEPEHRLMNEINLRHCESKFGRDSFSSRDLVVKLCDAIDFYKFLDVCYHKLNGGGTNHGIDKCGFIRINSDSVIPFTVKDGERYVPIFYFEGETDKLKTKSVELSGWELAYLKFCCKVQGIKNELFNNETCAVTSLQDIKSYFNSSDVFEEYWPKKVIDSQFLISASKQAVTGSNSWIRTPPPGPHTKHPVGVVKNGGVIAVNGGGGPAWNGAQTGARGAANIQQQLAAASRNAAAVAQAQAAARGAAAAGVRAMPHQYYTSQGALGGAVPSLVRPGAAQPQQNPSHPPSGANMTAAYAKVISNSYTNLTPAGTYKNGWPNGYTPANAQQIQQMIASGQIPAAPYASYQTSAPPSQPGAKPLAPPPLIPVMNSAASRCQQQQQRYLQAANAANPKTSAAPNAEIIDLSSPPNSPQARSRAAAQVNARTLPNGGIGAGLGNMLHVLYNRYDRALIDSFQVISEIQNPGASKPYRVTKARINQDTALTCINRNSFLYSEDLMTTISDFIATMAPNVHPRRVIEAFNVLSIKLYVPNRLQVLTLNETKRYKDLCMIIPLISVVDIKEHSGAISYVLSPESSGSSRGGTAQKRARMS